MTIIKMGSSESNGSEALDKSSAGGQRKIDEEEDEDERLKTIAEEEFEALSRMVSHQDSNFLISLKAESGRDDA